MAILATYILITKKKKEEELEWVLCIWYLVTFKNQTEVLLDWKSKVNAINQAFVLQLDLKTQKTNVRAQKMDSTTLEIYRIIVSIFFVLNKNNRDSFFDKSFLLVNVKLDIILEILFLNISNADINF